MVDAVTQYLDDSLNITIFDIQEIYVADNSVAFQAREEEGIIVASVRRSLQKVLHARVQIRFDQRVLIFMFTRYHLAKDFQYPLSVRLAVRSNVEHGLDERSVQAEQCRSIMRIGDRRGARFARLNGSLENVDAVIEPAHFQFYQGVLLIEIQIVAILILF